MSSDAKRRERSTKIDRGHERYSHVNISMKLIQIQTIYNPIRRETTLPENESISIGLKQHKHSQIVL